MKREDEPVEDESEACPIGEGPLCLACWLLLPTSLPPRQGVQPLFNLQNPLVAFWMRDTEKKGRLMYIHLLAMLAERIDPLTFTKGIRELDISQN